MAYLLANLESDIRGYTEVSATVLTDAILKTQNLEINTYRSKCSLCYF